MSFKLIMKKYTLSTSFLLAGCLFLPGCAGERLDKLEAATRSMQSDLTEIRTMVADHSSELGRTRAEVRALTGKTEEIQHAAIGKTQELENNLSRLQARVPPPAGVPEDLLAKTEERLIGIAGASADGLRAALTSIRTGSYEDARSKIQTFIDNNPSSALTDDAIFWNGIIYKQLKQCDRAVLAFSDVFQKFPAEDMTPPSLYFLAVCFDDLGSKNDAVLTLQKLVDEHANTAYASKARLLLSELRPSGGKKR